MGAIELGRRMIRGLSVAAVAASLSISLAGQASAVEYKLVYGGPTIWNDISNRNVAVGQTLHTTYFGSGQVLTATVWSDGVTNDISAPFGQGYAQAVATGINDKGVIVGYAGGTLPGTPDGPFPTGAFRYSGSGPLQDAEFLGAVQVDEFANPTAINNGNAVTGSSGIVAIAFATDPNAPITALSALGTLGGPRSVGTGINDAGLVVGGAQTTQISLGQPAQRAFVYDGTMHDLGTLSDFASAESLATGVNRFGAIVGFSDTNFGRQAFLHTGTGPLQASDALGTLGGPQSYGLGVNDLGEVVGSSSFDDTGRQHAFLYRNGAMINLNTLVELSPDYAGWELVSANGINNKGWIIGTMTFGGNATFGFILAPITGVPEPATWAVMLLGFGCVGAGLRRRRPELSAASLH